MGLPEIFLSAGALWQSFRLRRNVAASVPKSSIDCLILPCYTKSLSEANEHCCACRTVLFVIYSGFVSIEGVISWLKRFF